MFPIHFRTRICWYGVGKWVPRPGSHWITRMTRLDVCSSLPSQAPNEPMNRLFEGMSKQTLRPSNTLRSELRDRTNEHGERSPQASFNPAPDHRPVPELLHTRVKLCEELINCSLKTLLLPSKRRRRRRKKGMKKKMFWSDSFSPSSGMRRVPSYFSRPG